MLALDPDIAGQPSQPFRRETAPQSQAYECCDYADDHDEFSELAHREKVARIAGRHKVEADGSTI